MSTTLAELRPLVRHRLGLQDDDGMLPDASLNITINQALPKMATEFNWPWLITHETITAVVGQNEYTPPDRWVKTMWVKYNENELVSRQRVDLIQYDNESGCPNDFAIWEQKLWLSPAPDQAYVLEHSYIQVDNELNADGDTVLCPDWYIDVIVVYAALIEVRRMKDTGLEQQLLTDKKEWMHNIAKLVPEVDILPRVSTRRDFPLGH